MEGQPQPYAPGYAAPGQPAPGYAAPGYAVPVQQGNGQAVAVTGVQLVPVQVVTVPVQPGTMVPATTTTTNAAVATNTGPYNHRQHGTFYYWYYISGGMIGAIFLFNIINLIVLDVSFSALLFPFIMLAFALCIMISAAMSCKYLEIRDEGNRLIIEFGPCQNPLFCGTTTTTIAYNDISEFAPVEPGCMAHTIRFVNYDKQKRIKFMMQADMCDCCTGHEIYQITLRSPRCQYNHVRFTSDDGPALMAALRAKGVNVSDRAVRPCCCY